MAPAGSNRCRERSHCASTGLFSFYSFKGDLMRFEQAVNAIDQ
jgi:hypothetical protein